MSLRQEDISVATDRNVVGLVEQACSRSFVPVTGLAFRAEGEEYFSLLVELDDGVAAAVRDPDVVLWIDVNPVGPIPEQSLTERADELSVLVEFDDGVGGDAVPGSADHPEMSLGVELQIARQSHRGSGWKCQTVIGHGFIVQRRSFLHDEQLLFVRSGPLRIRTSRRPAGSRR